MSTLMRRVHGVSHIAPYSLCRVGDHGDAPVNPIDLMESLQSIEQFYRTPSAAARCRCPPAAIISSACQFCGASAERTVGMVHFDFSLGHQ